MSSGARLLGERFSFTLTPPDIVSWLTIKHLSLENKIFISNGNSLIFEYVIWKYFLPENLFQLQMDQRDRE